MSEFIPGPDWEPNHRTHDYRALVGWRSWGETRRNPQFSRASLEAGLATGGIGYQWWGEVLGGRRESGSGVSRHPAWTDDAFQAYADHMDRPEFRSAFSQLLVLAAEDRSAILCSETLWWRCHRRLLSDAAVLARVEVVHLLSPGRSQRHLLHPAARRGDDGWPVYDVGVQPELL